jgi:hypothetical protein
MNDEQQKAWGHSQVILAIPRTDKYEYRQYRYDREDRAKPATHLAHPSTNWQSLCGRNIEDWNTFRKTAKNFSIGDWSKDDDAREGSDRLCQRCVNKFQRIISSGG